MILQSSFDGPFDASLVKHLEVYLVEVVAFLSFSEVRVWIKTTKGLSTSVVP